MPDDRPHILIIEDNDDFAHLLTGMLEQEYSAEVNTAGTLDQGRDLLGSGRWDLVSLDYRVGDEDGLVLLREIASSGDGPPVILVTGQGQERLAAQSVELGARGYVIKDLKMRETFLAAVGRVLAEEAQRRAERSLLEQADELRASEERYRILTGNISDVIWTSDLELNFTYVSPAIFALTGYTVEEAMGLSMAEVITPESLQMVSRRFVTEISRAAETDVDPPIPVVIEVEQYRKDGTTFPVEVSVGFLRREDGTPYGVLGVTRDITERKKAEEVLRLTQFTVDHAADSVLWTTPEGEIIYANEEACRRRGYTLEEMLSLKVSDINADMWEDPDLWSDTVYEIEKDGHFTREFRHRTKAGEVFPVEATVNRFDFEGREIFVGSLRDITERKRDEEEIRALNRRLEGILSSVADGILTLGLDRNIISVNPAAERITGYSSGELVGNSTRMLYASEADYEEAGTRIYPAVMENGSAAGEIRARRADGAVVPVELSMALMKEEGEPAGVVIAFRDISERRRAEEALRASEERFRLMATASQDAIMVVGPDFTFRFFNEAAERMLGYTSAEVIGRSAVDIMAPPEFRDDLRGEMESFSQEGTAFAIGTTLELIAFTKDRSRIPVEISSAAVRVEGEWHALISMRDISDRKRAERLAALQRELAVTAAETADAREVIRVTVEAVPELTGLDMASIYLVDEETGDLNLIDYVGASEGFAASVAYYPADGVHVGLLMAGETMFVGSENIAEAVPAAAEEGATAFVIVPLRTADGVVGCLNMGSHERDSIPEEITNLLEVLAGQVAQSVSRARLAASVRASEEKYRLIYDNAGEGVYTYDRDLVLTDVNMRGCEIVGYSREELVGRNALEVGILHPDDLNKALRNIERIVSGGERSVTDEYRFITKEGVELTVEVTGAGLYDESGRFVGVTNIGDDVTEQRRAQRSLKENEQRLRLLTGSIQDIVAVVDNEGSYRYMSPSIKTVLGYEPTDIIGVSIEEYLEAVHPDDMGLIADAVSRMPPRSNQYSFRYRYRHADGHYVWLESVAGPLIGDDGTSTGTVITSRDITERVTAEEALRESERRYREMLENVHLGAVLLDTEGRITFINEYMAGMSGWTREEALGRNWFETFIPPEARELVQQYFRDSIENGTFEPATGENEIVTRSGERRVIRWYNTILRGEAGEASGVASLGEDVTRRRVALQALATSREQLRALSRHLTVIREDERADLARELHDELGQSLTGLKMDTVWLERNLMEGKPDLTQVTERLRSMADMIDSNIGVVRRIAAGLRPGILDDLGLVPALEWTVEDFSFRTGIAAECHSELGDVNLDQFTRTQVFRIVQEALTNVARHSGARHVKVRVGRDDGRLTVEVGDDGVGISSEAVASRDSLGIVGMHERARLIGGELVVSGDREEGTSVVLMVPSFEDDGGPD